MGPKRIASVERLRNTRDGNLVFAVTFEDGSVAKTEPDAQIASYAENSEWQGVDLDVTFRGDRIVGWALA